MMNTVPQSDEQLRERVSARYARTALQVLGTPSEGTASCCGTAEVAEPQPASDTAASSSCCASSCCTPDAGKGNPITSELYTQMELGEIPVAAALASLGCGNPTAHYSGTSL